MATPSEPSDPSAAPRPLAGIRVLDMSRVVSGPYAGRVLADLGADVVKVEPPDGDITQYAGAVIDGRSGLFTQMNAGKRNIGVDLARPGSVELVRSLVAVSDVLIENFRPSVMRRLGLGWDELSVLNPRLVMLSITGFGATSSHAERRAYAPVIHAASGLLGRTAELDGAMPTDIPLALGDILASLHGAVAVLAALRLRDETGTGQHIDMSMLEAVLASDDYLHYLVDERPEPYPTRGTVWDAPGGPLLLAASEKHAWATIGVARGLVAEVDPSAEPAARFAARRRALASWFAGFDTRSLLFDDLEALGLAFADVTAPVEVLDSPALVGRRITTRPDGPGTRPIVRMPYHFSAANAEPLRGAASRSEHTHDVLGAWLGLAPGAVDALHEQGVLIT